jgi:hypothetical protein
MHSCSPHSYYMPCPSHPPWLDHSNYTVIVSRCDATCDCSICCGLGVGRHLWLSCARMLYVTCIPSSPFAAHLHRVPGRLHWSYTPLLPCLVDVEKLGVKEGELWLLVLVGEGSFHLRLLRCLASRENAGVAGFSSVMVEMSCYLGSYGPGSGRAGGSLCYSHVHRLKTWHFQ